MSFERIFANLLSDKKSAFRIYKELLQVDNKKTNNPTKKMDTGLEQTLL